MPSKKHQKPDTAPKLSEAKVARARTLVRAGKATQAELARKYGVSRVSMHMAVTGKTFAWLKTPRPVKVSV